eukprot:CAMPEP_0115706508 /NCGR_PEP_ID=MMETSP0272-20121206/70832_1 /TAXON_ID=71861 /ORGANISM="Scrippsiella trochoidea, Strain CCMP3099" /LENGTH=142 /DNA_ID=CAMNT_0003147769 /DNA_START=9 /DNA_END=434 /DNA_ORIENTATION=+
MQLSLFCASQDGKHRAPMHKWGGDTDAAYKSFMAFRCDWPQATTHQPCHSIVVQEGETHADRGIVQACQETGILRESYNLVACVQPVYEKVDHLEHSGILKLPQWIEYNAMHGTQVHVEPAADLRPDDSSAQQLTANDCLYR